jgi:hypothetical protein
VSLRESLSSCRTSIQHGLFPWLEERVGPLTVPHRDLVKVLEVARIEAFVPYYHGLAGRPLSERAALARAFVRGHELRVLRRSRLKIGRDAGGAESVAADAHLQAEFGRAALHPGPSARSTTSDRASC